MVGEPQGQQRPVPPIRPRLERTLETARAATRLLRGERPAERWRLLRRDGARRM